MHKPELSFHFYLLILWTVLGFLLKLDNNEEYGCILFETSIFSIHNIVYSTISIVLLSVGYFSNNDQYRIFLFKGELFLWLYKLLFLKGGYAVGIAATPLSSIVWFDFIGIALRLILINQISKYSAKSLFFIIPVYLIMVVKTGDFY